MPPLVLRRERGFCTHVEVSHGCSFSTPEGQVHEMTQPLCSGEPPEHRAIPVTPSTPLTSLSIKSIWIQVGELWNLARWVVFHLLLWGFFLVLGSQEENIERLVSASFFQLNSFIIINSTLHDHVCCPLCPCLVPFHGVCALEP